MYNSLNFEVHFSVITNQTWHSCFVSSSNVSVMNVRCFSV